jgi:uncharacterized peroxidase-related enzyme
MPRIEPLPREKLSDIETTLVATEQRMGFVPNSLLTMGRRPAIVEGFIGLYGAVFGGGTVPPALKNLIAQVSSRAAGCAYCMAHTAHTAGRLSVEHEKEAALWDYETSPLFSEAERAALRVAQGAGQVPNAVTDADFAELRRHFDDDQIVEIVAVIGVFGFLNRWNDTMATQQSSPIEAGRKYLAARGWATGKHGAPAADGKAAE